MDYLGYEHEFKLVEKLTNELNDKRSEWIRRILFLASTLFGVLISLHTTIGGNLCPRLIFAASMVLLALGILLLSIALYGGIDNAKCIRRNYVEEAKNAIREHREVGFVFAGHKKIYTFCETTAYVFLIFSVLSLASYSTLLVFS